MSQTHTIDRLEDDEKGMNQIHTPDRLEEDEVNQIHLTDSLGYTNSRKALSEHVYDEDKGVTKCDSLGGTLETTIISEYSPDSLMITALLL